MFVEGIEGLFDQFVSVLEVVCLNVRGQALYQLGLMDFDTHFHAVLFFRVARDRRLGKG